MSENHPLEDNLLEDNPLEDNPLRIVVTGASRGLGLGFVEQYAAEGHRVWALARQPDRGGLSDVAARHPELVHTVACDVTDAASVAAAIAAFRPSTDAIDLLVNNAGIAGATDQKLGGLDFDDMRRVLEVNLIAPLRIAEAFLPWLEAGTNPRIVNITSRMGSIADNESGGSWAYRISKAALNMAARNMMLELRGKGIATMVVHPGWVQTDMGGDVAPLSVAESVRGMRTVIASLNLTNTGCFRDYSGADLPW